MKILKNTLKYNINLRTELDFPIKGIEFIDINPIFMNNKVFNDITKIFVNEIKDKNIDYIISPEARGFMFGCPVSIKSNIPFIPIRKKEKIPPTTVECEISYEKEYGTDIMCLPKIINDNYSGKNFYIIDDIYATGNTVRAIKESIEKLGGNIVGTGVLINIVELNNDNIFSIIDINEEN